MAKKQPKIENITDLHKFIKSVPKKNFCTGWTDRTYVTDKKGNSTEVQQYCAVGQLRAAFGAKDVANANSKAARKVNKLLTKLGIDADAIISANDGNTKGGPKTRVLKLLTDRMRSKKYGATKLKTK
jgi:hypothetical protein